MDEFKKQDEEVPQVVSKGFFGIFTLKNVNETKAASYYYQNTSCAGRRRHRQNSKELVGRSICDLRSKVITLHILYSHI